MKKSFFIDKVSSLFSSVNKIQQNNKKILFRYIVKELLLFFIISFVFFFLVFFVNQILLMAEDILKKRVPVIDVIKLIIYSLPFVVAQSAPFATLVGFLMCLGKLNSDNEILILRATGSSYKILLVPVLILGLSISVVSFFINDYLLPLGTIKYNDLYRNIILSNPAIEIEPHSIKRTNEATLIIGDVNEKIVSDIIMLDTDKEGNQRIILATKTEIEKSNDRSILMQLKMNEPSIIQLNKKKKYDFDYLYGDLAYMNIFAKHIFSNSGSGMNPREMTSYDLNKVIKKMEKGEEKASKNKLNTYKLEYNKKYSLPFGSLFFSFLALPLAILFGKNNGQTIGLIIGILISVLYWAMMILGQTFGIRNGLNGFWTMWFPNIVIFLAGIFLYLKLVKK